MIKLFNRTIAHALNSRWIWRVLSPVLEALKARPDRAANENVGTWPLWPVLNQGRIADDARARLSFLSRRFPHANCSNGPCPPPPPPRHRVAVTR